MLDRIYNNLSRLGGFMAFWYFLFVGLAAAGLVLASTLDLTDVTSGMSQGTIVNTINTNNARTEAAISSLEFSVNFLPGQTIPGSMIQANAIGSSQIAANAVGNSEMADNAIGSAEVVADSLTAADIATGAIGGPELLDGGVDTPDLSTNVQALLTAGAGRNPYLVDVALADGVTYVGDLRTRFKATGLTNDVATAMLSCGGFIYVAINDTVSTDHLYKIDPVTMTQSGSVINLGANDNPTSMVCDPSGNVYTLNANSLTISKITPGGTVTTLKDLATFANAVDLAYALAINPAGTDLYFIGSDNSIASAGAAFRVNIATPATTTTYIFAPADLTVVDTFVAKVNGGMKLGILYGETSGVSASCVKMCDISAGLSCVAFANNCAAADDVTLWNGGAGDSHQRAYFDGTQLVLWPSAGSAARVNLTSEAYITGEPNWGSGSSTVPNTAAGEHGRATMVGGVGYYQLSTGTVNVLRPNWYADAHDQVQVADYIEGQASPGDCGLAHYGPYLIACTRNTGNTEFTVSKTLVN